METPCGGHRSTLTDVGQEAGNGQQRQVVIDDDHLGNMQVRVIGCESSSEFCKFSRQLTEKRVKISVVGQVQFPVNNRSHDVAPT